MPNYSRERKQMLRHILDLSGADPTKRIQSHEISGIVPKSITEGKDLPEASWYMKNWQTNETVLKQLISFDLVAGENCGHDGRCEYIRITEEGIKEAEMDDRTDIVELFQNTLRRHPFWGRVAVVVIAITFVMTVVTQGAGFLKTVGIIPEKTEQK